MARNIRAVIFDYGNVLCPMPPPSAFEEMAIISGIPTAPFVESLWRYRLDYDRGTLDGTSYWKKVATANQIQFTSSQIAKLMKADFALWVHPSPVLLRWAHKLQLGGIKTSILSNMPPDFSRYLRSNADWLSHFDVKIFSGELGVIKPDAKIYLSCLEALAVYPEEALFIDDIEVNVAAARALGIQSVKFESIAQMARDVAQFNWVDPFGEIADSIVSGN